MDLFGQNEPTVAPKKALKKASAPAPTPEIAAPAVVAGPEVGGVKVGFAAVYRSLYSGYFQAKITAVRSMLGMVDIEVFNDRGARMMHLTRVVFRDSFAKAAPGEAYIGERPKQ